jgi:hypothetical protein
MPGKGRPFQKGVSGNPGGRPKVLGDAQEESHGGTEGVRQIKIVWFARSINPIQHGDFTLTLSSSLMAFDAEAKSERLTDGLVS